MGDMSLAAAIASFTHFGDLLRQWMYDFYWITRLLFAVSYVMGIGFMVRALYYLKVYGEARTMMASQSNFLTPVMLMITGASLIFLPTAIDILNYTIYDSNEILAYPSDGSAYDSFLLVVGMVVQIVGFIAVVRGLVMLSNVGRQSAQPQTAKAVTHLIGGAMAINFWASVSIFSSLFGVFWF